MSQKPMIQTALAPASAAELSDELAALMCSKLCHDLISPIGALGNGLEVLEDEDDNEMRDYAMKLIVTSARTASAKLQYARMAFGLSGGRGGTLDLGEASRTAAEYFANTKAELDWAAQAEARPKDEVRLVMNLLLVALMAIPRGGKVSVSLSPSPFRARITAAGQGAGLNEETRAALDGYVDMENLDARMIQPYFAGIIARRLGARVALTADCDTLSIETGASA